ncbi:MAG TPA: hypothetical protein ENN23_06480 [Deltaproteobacteria bacterium]|nr:hypothetical protein [Deltaproteobacteria bacterium]
MEILISIVSFVLGMLTIYMTAYSKAKGRNLALIEDISRLEDEKQRIIAKYNAETEEIRKQHSLDIEKRKYQYEDKRAQFTKFFALLDEFNSKGYKVFVERFSPMMNEFLVPYIEDGEAQNNAIGMFNERTQTLFNELYEEQIKVNNETNTIRLVSSPEIDALLDKLELAIKKSTDDTVEMMRFMSTPQFWGDQGLIAPYQQQAEESGKLVQHCRNKLRERMKHELNEI